MHTTHSEYSAPYESNCKWDLQLQCNPQHSTQITFCTASSDRIITFCISWKHLFVASSPWLIHNTTHTQSSADSRCILVRTLYTPEVHMFSHWRRAPFAASFCIVVGILRLNRHIRKMHKSVLNIRLWTTKMLNFGAGELRMNIHCQIRFQSALSPMLCCYLLFTVSYVHSPLLQLA